MPQEIERKYLLARLPADLGQYPHAAIRQGYLAVGDPEVRLRQRGERFFETVKGKGTLVRMEREIELDATQFETLWPATAGRRVEKVRYEIPFGGHVIELDVYAGHLEGLFTAEVEFASLDACEAFVPPDWFGREISGEAAFKNRNLASQGLPEEAEARPR